ncbi:hypothetical protein MIR68_002469 [Amoeboaphelidium protococcarum]|nr:hypothetical protein MIR68_002469 [Amoeboaphelidium protococcarum]
MKIGHWKLLDLPLALEETLPGQLYQGQVEVTVDLSITAGAKAIGLEIANAAQMLALPIVAPGIGALTIPFACKEYIQSIRSPVIYHLNAKQNSVHKSSNLDGVNGKMLRHVSENKRFQKHYVNRLRNDPLYQEKRLYQPSSKFCNSHYSQVYILLDFADEYAQEKTLDNFMLNFGMQWGKYEINVDFVPLSEYPAGFNRWHYVATRTGSFAQHFANLEHVFAFERLPYTSSGGKIDLTDILQGRPYVLFRFAFKKLEGHNLQRKPDHLQLALFDFGFKEREFRVNHVEFDRLTIQNGDRSVEISQDFFKASHLFQLLCSWQPDCSRSGVLSSDSLDLPLIDFLQGYYDNGQFLWPTQVSLEFIVKLLDTMEYIMLDLYTYKKMADLVISFVKTKKEMVQPLLFLISGLSFYKEYVKSALSAEVRQLIQHIFRNHKEDFEYRLLISDQ